MACILQTQSDSNLHFLDVAAILWFHFVIAGALMFATTVLCFVVVGNFGIGTARATLALKSGLFSHNDSPLWTIYEVKSPSTLLKKSNTP